MNLIYEEAIKHSKPIPDFSQTDQYQVAITLHGTVQGPTFIRFLEQLGNDRVAAFSTQDFLILDLIHREQKLDAHLNARVAYLLDQGIIERVTGRKFVLSRQFYAFLGKKGHYTRKKGLDRAQNKASLLNHIQDNAATGSPLSELLQVLPSHSDSQVQALLRSLQRAGQVHLVGKTKAGRWFPGPSPTTRNHKGHREQMN